MTSMPMFSGRKLLIFIITFKFLLLAPQMSKSDSFPVIHYVPNTFREERTVWKWYIHVYMQRVVIMSCEWVSHAVVSSPFAIFSFCIPSFCSCYIQTKEKHSFNSIQMLSLAWHQYSSFRGSLGSVLKLNLHFNAITGVFNYVLFPDIGVKTSYRMTDIFILPISFACKWIQLNFTDRYRGNTEQ